MDSARRIILIRHGRPEIITRWKLRRIYAHEIPELFREYDASGVDPLSVPGMDTIEAAAGGAVFYVSRLLRAVETAERLGIALQTMRADSRFNEIAIPWWQGRYLKLHPIVWAGIIRVLWMFGYSPNTESKAQVLLRAQWCAGTLDQSAGSAGPVVLVGHGAMNYLIWKQLRRMGWRAATGYRWRHWGASILER